MATQKLVRGQVAPTAADKAFIAAACQDFFVLRPEQQSRLQVVAKKLTWGEDKPALTHPQAKGVADVLWDVAEGMYFDGPYTSYWPQDFLTARQAAEDFRTGKIYPAQYVLSGVVTEMNNGLIEHSWGFHIRHDDDRLTVECAQPSAQKILQKLAKRPLSGKPQTDLESLKVAIEQISASQQLVVTGINAFLQKDLR